MPISVAKQAIGSESALDAGGISRRVLFNAYRAATRPGYDMYEVSRLDMSRSSVAKALQV